MGSVSANDSADAKSVSELKARVEAERAGRPFVLFDDPDDGQQLFVFAPGSTAASVGRQPPVDVLLDFDEQVSRVHARFEQVGDGWEVVDDGLSRNGTFVNGHRVNVRCRLNDGDILRFGSTTVTYRSPGAEQPATPGAAVGLSTSQRRVLEALCRPYKGRSGFANPAPDEQIAEELFLAVGAVRAHLKVLYAKLEVEELPPGEKRVRLVERAFSSGLISEQKL